MVLHTSECSTGLWNYFGIIMNFTSGVTFLSCRCSGCVSSNLGLCVRCVQADSKKVSKIAIARVVNRFRFIE